MSRSGGSLWEDLLYAVAWTEAAPEAPGLSRVPGDEPCTQQVQSTDEPGDEEQTHIDAALQLPDRTHRPSFYPGRHDDRVVPEDAEHQDRDEPPCPTFERPEEVTGGLKGFLANRRWGRVTKMGRLIRLGDWMPVDARQDRPVVTPSENAAIALGAPHTSLESLARGVLGEEGVAYPLMVQRILRETVREVLGSTDPEGVARTLLPPIRELFRASGEFGSNPGTEQAKRGC